MAEELAQRLGLHPRRPGHPEARTCSSSSARSSSAARTRWARRASRCPTALERAGDFSQSVDANGNPYPVHPRLHDRAALQRRRTRAGCFQDGGVLGKIPANRLYAPTLAALSLFPTAERDGPGRLQLQEPDAVASSPLNQSLIRVDYQFNSNWRVTGRYMFHTNKNDAAVRHQRLVGRAATWTRSTSSRTSRGATGWCRRPASSTTRRRSRSRSGSAHNSLDHYTDERRSCTRAGRRHVEPADALHDADPERPAFRTSASAAAASATRRSSAPARRRSRTSTRPTTSSRT